MSLSVTGPETSSLSRRTRHYPETWIAELTLNHLDELRNNAPILGPQHPAKGPLAVIHLPLKLKLGLARALVTVCISRLLRAEKRYGRQRPSHADHRPTNAGLTRRVTARLGG